VKSNFDRIDTTELRETTAFGNLGKIATSYTDGLEKSILDLVYKQNDLVMSDILNKFGNYPNVHRQVKKLLLENKLVLYELEPNSVVSEIFESQQIKLVNPEVSKWVDLGAAQPCLTCFEIKECSMDNPLSPATCQDFENWLQEEIELEFTHDKEE